VGQDEPIAELVPLMTNRGLHHIPVVDGHGIFAGVVSHSDLLAALFEGKLADACVKANRGQTPRDFGNISKIGA
jgi:CBS domain-containing membrane protein